MINIKNTTTLLFLSIPFSFYSYAQDLNFVQYPAGSASIEPSPNVIISVDDSGSMGSDGINSLKNALKDTFASTNIADNRLRIAWQSMNGCNNIPSSRCNNKNAMRILDSSHRTNFLNWVDTLDDNGGTPSHKMIRNAGDYLSRNRSSFSNPADWPWSEVPGSKVGNVLACRKSFHIFMTDGSWNSSTDNTNNHRDADRLLTGYKTIGGNLDGATRTLPDGVIYAPSTNSSLKVYSDNWGGSNTTDGNINTLSDLAFHYWATDLQPDIPNSVKKITKVDTDEVITKNNISVTLTPYWNPKNNPATWQSLTTYTIGFGTATDWRRTETNNTQLLTWAGDTYSGSYHDIVVGSTLWPSPLCSRNSNGNLIPNILGNLACDGSGPYGTHNTIGNRRTELWHMAINGRGKFIPAKNSDDLKNAFKDIINNIIEDTSQPITSFASASGSVSTKGTTAYISSYDAQGWKGGIYSRKVAQGSGDLLANPDWGSKGNGDPLTTGDKLDALSNTQIANRLVLSSNTANSGINFDSSALSAEHRTLLLQRRSTVATPGVTEDEFLQKTVNFIRGDRSSEGLNVGNIPFRKRESRQGDIVNSAIWYTGSPNQGYSHPGYSNFTQNHATRIPMLYIGGNDGMLHGFSAIDGTERIAYIPRGVIKNLPLLTVPNYDHRYFVDGSAFSGDVDTNTAADAHNWRTMLVSSLGAGGKGYFVLDVTAPGAISSGGVSSNFSAANASSLVVLDTTETTDPDIGHIFSEPVTYEFNNQISAQITRMNNGRWAVVMGNGYNSTNQRPVLLIQYLDGDKSLHKITAGATAANNTSNGLSAPRLVDINDDGMPDVVYAGDLKGNLWKFDVASTNHNNWGVAFNDSPLFTAEYASGQSSMRQPITTAPIVRANRSVGGLMVAFGTGRNVTEGDRTDVSVQSFYSLLDNTRYVLAASGADKGKVAVSTSTTSSAITNGRNELVPRTFDSSPIAGAASSSGQTFWNMGDQTDLNYSEDSKRGWYLDLPESGERVLRHPRFYVAGSNVLEILSDVPASGGSTGGESCEPASTPAKAWRTLLGIEFGKRPNQQLLDANGDGAYSSLDDNTNRMTSSPKELALTGKGEQIRIGTEGSSKGNELARPTSTVNWRLMQ